MSSLISRTFNFTSVGASSYSEQSFAIPEAVSFVHVHKVTCTPSVDAGECTVSFFKKDTFASDTKVYELGPGSTKLYDPASYDGSTYSELLEGFLFPYEDDDSSDEFHIRVDNDDSQSKDFDVVVTYSVPYTTGSATFSSIIIDGTSAEAFLVRKDGDTGDIFVVDTSNERVGIGGTPAKDLHLQGAAPIFRIEDSAGNYTDIQQSGTSLFFDPEASTGNMTFRTSTGNKILDLNVSTRVATLYVPNGTVTPDFNNGLAFEIDETSNVLRFRVKYTAGTAKSGTVALT